MKKFLRQSIVDLLGRWARKRIASTTPVIGITGSLGKTTTKDALVTILRASGRQVFASSGGYNSEFGVPLTLLAERSGWSSPWAWAGVLARSWRKSQQTISTDLIVLELGVDRPGDMDFLLRVAQPQIGIWTAVAPVHLAPGQFNSLQAIAREKSKLIRGLPRSGLAVLNADDPLVSQTRTKANVISFGFGSSADLRASQIRETDQGLTAKINYGKKQIELRLPIWGQHNLYPILAALAVAIYLGCDLQRACAALWDFRLPPGRGNLLAGKNKSQILDSSYNANPASLRASLELLRRARVRGRKLVLLGQMNELGAESEKYHGELGRLAVGIADEVYAVHGQAASFAKSAARAGKPNQFFATAKDAGKYLKNVLQPGDLLLVKGSQNNVWLEQAIAPLLAKKSDRKWLCRQDH